MNDRDNVRDINVSIRNLDLIIPSVNLYPRNQDLTVEVGMNRTPEGFVLRFYHLKVSNYYVKKRLDSTTIRPIDSMTTYSLLERTGDSVIPIYRVNIKVCGQTIVSHVEKQVVTVSVTG